MKDSFLMLVIGIAIGAIITAAGFILFDKKDNTNMMGNTEPKQYMGNMLNEMHNDVKNVTNNMENNENTEISNMVDENAIKDGIKNPGQSIKNVVNEIEKKISE